LAGGLALAGGTNIGRGTNISSLSPKSCVTWGLGAWGYLGS
jgi:hypothetical protein